MDRNIAKIIGLFAIALALGCSSDKEPERTAAPEAPGADETSEPAEPAAAADPPAAEVKTDKGVDLASKTIKIGALNDESGPAATIGKPYAVGKRVLAEQINAGGSGLLPDGWKIDMVEKDHGYNPNKSVQAYNQIKDEVLLISTSFGTPNTLPLRPMLERDNLIALPASLSSEMAKNKYTVPAGPSYEVAAMRAMDFVASKAQDKAAIKAAVVYQQDDYGLDGLNGWKKAAEHHGISVISEQTVAPGQKDMAAVVTALKSAGATHVLLVVLPSATGPILGESAKQQYGPQWIGSTPTWIDAFFNKEVIPSQVFGNYLWISTVPYWGEDLPGMKEFEAAYEKYGKDKSPQDMYILFSYVQGLYSVEIIKRAIEAGDLTRDGLMAAVQTVESFDGGGLFQAVSTNKFPYVTGTKSRILKPDFEAKTWTVVEGYADPVLLGGGAVEGAEGATAEGDEAEGAEAEGAEAEGAEAEGEAKEEAAAE